MEKNYENLFEKAFNNKEDLTEFAVEFSEGDNLLKETLLNLWKNNIKTFGCCIGHDLPEYTLVAYLSIIIDQHSIDFIKQLYNKLHLSNNGVSFSISSKDKTGIFTTYMRDGSKDYVLNSYNECIGEKTSANNSYIDECLFLLEYANSLNLIFSIDFNKDDTLVMFRKPNDTTKVIDFLPLDEVLPSLDNLADVSHLFIHCKTDELNIIVEILRNNKKNDEPLTVHKP